VAAILLDVSAADPPMTHAMSLAQPLTHAMSLSCQFPEAATENSPVSFEEDPCKVFEREVDLKIDAPASLALIAGVAQEPRTPELAFGCARATWGGPRARAAPAAFGRASWSAGYGASRARAASWTDAEMDPRLAVAEAPPPPPPPKTLPSPPMGRNLAVWLEQRGLGKYAPALEALGARRVSDLAHLDDGDLEALGLGEAERADIGVVLVG